MEERFETFTVLITRISRSIKRIKADEMADFELKGPHVSCLYYLSQQDGMTAAELCERCDEDKAAITKCHNALLEEALREMKNDEIDMLVIDEFCAGYNCGLVDKALADEIILHKPEKCELVLTGRDPEQKYVDAADYVSEIRAVKHPYEKGIDARRGIEF